MIHMLLLDMVHTVPGFHTLWPPVTFPTVCASVWPLSPLSDHSDNCLITDFPPSDNFLCTPSSLVPIFWIPLCPSTYFVIDGDIFDKCLRLLWLVEQRKMVFCHWLTKFIWNTIKFKLIKALLRFLWGQNAHTEWGITVSYKGKTDPLHVTKAYGWMEV